MEFWLPEVAALIRRFADRADTDQRRDRPHMWFDSMIHRPELSFNEWNKAANGVAYDPEDTTTPRPRPLTASELVAIGSDGSLPGRLFERCLDDLLERAARTGDDDGVLLILRNEVPSLLLPDAVIRERGAALFHDDLQLVAYCHGAHQRRNLVSECIDRIALVLPANARSIMLYMDAQPACPSQAESAGGQIGVSIEVEDVWRQVAATLRRLAAEGRQSMRMFDGNLNFDDAPRQPSETLLVAANGYSHNESLMRVAALPDCWVWLSRRALGAKFARKLTIERAIDDLERHAPDFDDNPEDVDRMLRDGDIRIVTVSRARYNPRYRGRLVVSARDACKLLVHVALCMRLSKALSRNDILRAFQ